ncbi:MAG: RluA family pseudouridine synthase [Myxococcota bacterium]
MRVDRFLAKWFRTHSRNVMARHIRDGFVTDAAGKVLRASVLLKADEVLQIWIPGIAADGPPPPFPRVAYEDDELAVVVKPPGMMCHPSGEQFVYALIGLAREQWPDRHIDLVHRIDADTSGLVAISKSKAANIFFKEAIRTDQTTKIYEAIVRGHPEWDEHLMQGPIGLAGGIVRIQQAVRDDGLPSWTHATVLGRKHSPVGPIAHVRCQIRTGRTHQIRVHLAHAGFPILGDRLYGPRCEAFLDVLDHGLTNVIIEEVGAPRHALHSARLQVPHPNGGSVQAESAPYEDMRRWWDTPQVLPLDGREAVG